MKASKAKGEPRLFRVNVEMILVLALPLSGRDTAYLCFSDSRTARETYGTEGRLKPFESTLLEARGS